MATESGLRELTKALAGKAIQLSNEIDGASTDADYHQILHFYNSLCTVLDYLNTELKTEPFIDGLSGPIPVTWQKKH